MKRKLTVISGSGKTRIVVNAMIDAREKLTRDEVEEMRDELADRVMSALSTLAYAQTPLSRITVR